MGEHLGALVVADLQHLLDDVGDRQAGHAGHLGAAAGAFLLRDRPVTWMPSLRRYAANNAAAVAVGSASRPYPSGCDPLSAHSAVMGATTSSVT